MLIGLTGAPGVGKDASALALMACGYQRTAFADALRAEVAAAWHIDPRLLTERATKETPLRALAVGNADNALWLRYCATQGWKLMDERSPRWVLQTWGEWRRLGNPMHWIEHVRYWVQYQRAWAGHTNLVVTDVRYGNEADALRALGGLIVRVHRPDVAPLAADTAAHRSEQEHAAIAVDGDISNRGSLAALSAEVLRVVAALGQQADDAQAPASAQPAA